MRLHTEKDQKEIKKHGNYEFPVHISLEKIQAYEQDSFPWHWHPEIELTWVMSGQIEYLVNDKKYLLREGDGLFCNSNSLHSGYMVDRTDCNYLSVTFHPRFIYGYENSLLQTKYVDFITANESWHSLRLQRENGRHQEIVSQIRNIYQIFRTSPPDYELQVHLILAGIWQKLYLHYHSLPVSEQQPQKHLTRLKEILSYIQEHYAQELTLDEIAEHVNICKSECCRYFKKYMKITIFDYILFLRIRNSLPLLKEGESVTKIASMTGFSTPAYYGQIFKRYMGCSPSRYRKDHMGKT
jgi:AraC-like DNA-binding protein/quercetin dioxygenase-like cupin family protein